MAHGSRVCPQCGRLNAAEDKTCFNCGKRLLGPVGTSAAGFWTDFSADGLPATKLLAGWCIVVYGLMMVGEGSFRFEVAVSGAFRLSTLLRFGVLYGDLAWHEPWRLLAAVSMHFGLLHIGMNMLSLINLGRSLEPHFGSARFMILYVWAGILGFVASQWWYGSSPPTAGASGAIFGLIGAMVGVLLVRRDPRGRRALVNYLVYAVILSFMLPVNTAAHIGGFFAGILLGGAFEWERQPHQRAKLMLALAGLCFAASVGSLALSARSPVWKQVRQIEMSRAEEAERGRLDSE
ncbi:MAG TPA: rhomboid family intramembrane serine protease [Polyangiaceae bacterium]|nr:rhomboid family intramembrane serine protease [Polyangiaceae bacterium]